MDMDNKRQLQAMAHVALLLDTVDMVRLFTVRDRVQSQSSKKTRTAASQPYVKPQLAFREYLRFLTIKILCTERPATDLSPSPYIHQLWQAHILDTTAYAPLREKYSDRLEHDPTVIEGAYNNQRFINTLDKYVELFGVPPLGPSTEAIWAPDSMATPKSPSGPSTVNQMWVSVLLPSGQWMDLELTAKQTLLDVKKALEQSQGIRVDEQCMVHLGKQLSDDSHSLHAMLKSDGISAGDTGVVEIVLVKTHTRLRMSMDSKR